MPKKRRIPNVERIIGNRIHQFGKYGMLSYESCPCDVLLQFIDSIVFIHIITVMIPIAGDKCGFRDEGTPRFSLQGFVHSNRQKFGVGNAVIMFILFRILSFCYVIIVLLFPLLVAGVFCLGLRRRSSSLR